MIKAKVAGERLSLDAKAGAYWEKEETLFLADLHLGKAAHFRKAGLAVPMGVSDSNMDKLIALLLEFKPSRVIFLGDLFHSEWNHSLNELGDLVKQFNTIAFELVEGNHDILDAAQYEKIGLIVHTEGYVIEPFILTHHPLEKVHEYLYNLSGHIHPCVVLNGSAKQRLRLPCFYFGKKQGILPAFGAFTGMGEVLPKMGDQVFVIIDDTVLQVS
ncbi:MAG: ligase-associated DNA damage response endonuclease PdeM [Bacteroidota bacterium]